MAHGDAHDHFARRSRPGMRPVNTLGTEHFNAAIAKVFPLALAEQRSCSRQQRVTRALRFSHRIEADNTELRRAAKTIHVGGRYLISICRRSSQCSAHTHAVDPVLFDSHLAKIA